MKMNTFVSKICCIGFLCLLQSQLIMSQIQKVSQGNIQLFAQFPSRFVTARNVEVWLPNGYSSKQKYAVLYMHDGQMLFDSTQTWNHQAWEVEETLQKLIDKGEIPPCIVVGIWNAGKERHQDYFPQRPFENLPLTQQDSLYKAKRSNEEAVFAGKIQSNQYLQFLVKELKPFIDSTFSTYKDRSHTFIAGASMGGLISMYAMCEYPKVFGGAACISTHWPGIFHSENNPIPAAFMTYLDTHLPSPKRHKFYFDFGTETLDAMYEPYQNQVDSIMKHNHYKAKSWMTRKFEGENHSEVAWKKRFSLPVLFLMGKSS